jgi:hypothetical protein
VRELDLGFRVLDYLAGDTRNRVEFAVHHLALAMQRVVDVVLLLLPCAVCVCVCVCVCVRARARVCANLPLEVRCIPGVRLVEH